jgi:hypothetical protein
MSDLIGPLADLQRAGAITPTSLTLSPDLTLDQWEAIGRYLGRARDATAWWLGDYIVRVEAIFGERGYQLIEATGRSPETLRRYAWVARKIAPARRREGLSFTHHELVAGREPAEQERLLDLAEREALSVPELRERRRRLPRFAGKPSADGGASHPERIEEAARRAWRSSALNVTRDAYVTPVEPMQALGRLLDGGES